MKRILCALICMLLLAGCSVTPTPTQAPSTIAAMATVPATSAPETLPAETTIPTSVETMPPTTQPADPITQMLAEMTLEEKVGQLFLARCPDIGALEDVQNYHLGGYILFGRDIEGQTPDSLRQAIAAYQENAAIPMLIAVDEEGGTVVRVSDNNAFRQESFPSPRSLYAEGGLHRLLSMEKEKCELLHSVGINVNLAPVCDVTTDPDAFMYDRSLGLDPVETGKCIYAMVKTMKMGKIGSVLKHFPGYGNNTDTHVAAALDSRTLTELQGCDLVPFQYGIDAECGAIMVSHTIIAAMDENLPASLSPEVNRVLRENMGFDGVVITDDLAMEAVTDTYGNGECAVLAILAGNDLLCSTYYAEQYGAVLDAAETGRISSEILDAAVSRVLRWKQSLGLVD